MNTPYLRPRSGRRRGAPVVALLGAAGRLGRRAEMFARSFGCVTVGVDPAIPGAPTAAEAVGRSEMVVCAVPTEAAAAVLSEVVPLLGRDRLLVDLSSVKHPLAAVHAAAPCEVLSLHPMFAPSTTDLRRQAVVSCRVRHGPLGRSVEAALRLAGARVVPMTTERHDRLTAYVQALHHVTTVAFGAALADSGLPLGDFLSCASPVYRLRMATLGRILSHDPYLYAGIGSENPYAAGALRAFGRRFDELSAAAAAGDAAAFAGVFETAAAYLGGYAAEASRETDYLVGRLVERDDAVRSADTSRVRPS